MEIDFTKTYQAIATKKSYFRGAPRMMAKSQAGRRYYAWQYDLSLQQNHKLTAMHYACDMGWSTTMVGGGLPDGETIAHVAISENKWATATAHKADPAMPDFDKLDAEDFAYTS